MRVLVVGGGGREHALAWKIAQSPQVDAVLAAPGSDAIGLFATCFPELKAADTEGLVALARAERVGMVVIGPEDPLASGLADRLRDEGVVVFGPSAAAAKLEASKAFAKLFSPFLRQRTLLPKSFKKFSRNVIGIGSTSAISTNKQLSPISKRVPNSNK